jgi:hypothetical protein
MSRLRFAPLDMTRRILGMTLVLTALLLAAMSCEKETGIDTDTDTGDGNGKGNGQDTTALAALAAPGGLTATTDSAARSATLSWNAVDEAESYGLVFAGDTLAVDGTAYTAPHLDYNTTYTWQVRAQSGARLSEWTAGDAFELKSTPAEPVPPSVPVPTGLQQQIAGRTSATLTWNTSPEADDYQIAVKVTNAAVSTANLYTTHAGWWAIPLAEETAYTWQVRTRKGDRYSEWSGVQYFVISATPLVELLIGHWTATDAVIIGRFGNGENNEMELDGLLGRSHPTGDVTVSVADGEMTLTGMDNYLTGGAIPAGFNIDGQLVDLPLISDEATGTVSATVDISSSNVYTQSMNVKIGDITFLEPFIATLPTCYQVCVFGVCSCIMNVQDLIKGYHITSVTMQVKKVTVTGALKGANSAAWSLVYEVEVTAIDTDISDILLERAEISEADLPGKIPTPQLLLSAVATER